MKSKADEAVGEFCNPIYRALLQALKSHFAGSGRCVSLSALDVFQRRKGSQAGGEITCLSAAGFDSSGVLLPSTALARFLSLLCAGIILGLQGKAFQDI